jgi:hypothetical protein
MRGGSPGRPPGALNKATREIREAARAILDRPEYRASLQKRLDAGQAPHMETLLHHYAFGKPKEVVERRNEGPMVIRWADDSKGSS